MGTPRIESIEIPKDKIGEIIGPKGAVIRELEEVTGAKIEIEEADGKGIVRIASSDSEALAAAMERVTQIAFPPEAEIGAVYEGKVVNITKFGAFVKHPSGSRRATSHLTLGRFQASRASGGIPHRRPGAQGAGP